MSAVGAIVSAYRWVAGGLYMIGVCTASIAASLVMPVHAWDPCLKRLLRGLFKVLFIRVKVRGTERVPRGRACVFMSNHVSYLDLPIFAAFLPGVIRGFELASHFRWPLWGPFLRSMGNIPVDRTSVFSSVKSFRDARRRIAGGDSLVILPEAERTHDGRMQPFKRLPFLMAIKAGADLVPIGLSGLYSLWPRGSRRIVGRSCALTVGEPVPAESVRSLSADELLRVTRERISSLIERP